MHILICPDKFKGSLSGQEAGEAIARGVRRALPAAEIIIQPLADGGEGSLELMASLPGMRRHRLEVTGPLRTPVTAEYLLGNGRALVESAQACGLHLVPPHARDPKHTTTIGVGMLVEDALARGARELTLYLGGSSTNDCGAGMAAAVGYRFFGDGKEDFIPMADSLGLVRHIDVSGKLASLEGLRCTAVCDVDNPLLGPRGATYTYARQKGAAEGDLPLLEDNMACFARLLQTDLGLDVAEEPGAGAAGGLGAGAVAFLGARLRRGIDVVFDAVDFDRLAAGADLIITGEGKVDEQTLHGKVVAGVIARGRPTLVVCGTSSVAAEVLGVEQVLSLTKELRLSPQQAIDRAAFYLEQLVYGYLTHTLPSAIREGE